MSGPSGREIRERSSRMSLLLCGHSVLTLSADLSAEQLRQAAQQWRQQMEADQPVISHVFLRLAKWSEDFNDASVAFPACDFAHFPTGAIQQILTVVR